MNRIHYAIMSLICISLWACGKSNENGVMLSPAGKHPALWVAGGMHAKEYVAGPANCVECHGSDLSGGISKVSCLSSARSGITCHATSPAANPAGCISCHGKPPATNKHIKHMALANVTCDACHNNLGPGKASHANGTVNAALSPVYNSKPAAVILNADGTCSNVSCHGGQTTPKWTDPVVILDCINCHEFGTTQFNSYNSGISGATNLHQFHLDNFIYITCSTCHNTANLATDHYSHLETAAMEGPASATIGGGTTGVASYVPASRSCTPTDTTSFPTGPCHATRAWP